MEKTAEDVIEITEMPELDEIMTTDEVPTEDHLIIEEPAQEKVDYTKSQDLGSFMDWINDKITNLPTHSGKTTAGCERVIAHLKMLDKEISKAIARDTDCLLDDQAVEKFRKDIRKMVKKLEKRHKEINDAYDADDEKYAELDGGLTKEADMALSKSAELFCKLCGHKVKDQKEGKVHAAAAHRGEDVTFTDIAPAKASADCSCSVKKEATVVESDNCPDCKIKLWAADEKYMECIACDKLYEKAIIKQAGTPRIQLVMTPLERALTSILINGTVSQGKSIEATYAELKKTYKLTDREELSLQQLMLDMGYPTTRRFVDMPHGNIEFATNYQA